MKCDTQPISALDGGEPPAPPAAAALDAELLGAAWLGTAPDPTDVPPLVAFRASAVPTWMTSVACSYFVPLSTTRNRVGRRPSLGTRSAGDFALPADPETGPAASGLFTDPVAEAAAPLATLELEELLLVWLSR